MSCGVGRRRSSGLMWLWLWRRPKAAPLIQPLAWELPYAMGAALKSKKKKKKKAGCWIFENFFTLVSVGICLKISLIQFFFKPYGILRI